MVEQDYSEAEAGWLYYLEVLKVYRGKIGRNVVVFSENASARVVMKIDKEYFVFASLSNGLWERWLTPPNIFLQPTRKLSAQLVVGPYTSKN